MATWFVFYFYFIILSTVDNYAALPFGVTFLPKYFIFHYKNKGYLCTKSDLQKLKLFLSQDGNKKKKEVVFVTFS